MLRKSNATLEEFKKISEEIVSIQSDYFQKLISVQSKKFDEMNEVLTSLAVYYSSVGQEKNNVMKRVEVLENNISEHLNEIKGLEEKILEQSREIKSYKEDINFKDGYIDDLYKAISGWQKDNISLTNKVNEHQKEIEEQKKEIDTINSKIILSEDNAYHGGRPPMFTDEEVTEIRSMLRSGMSQRKVADIMGASNVTISKIDDRPAGERGERKTKAFINPNKPEDTN